MQTRAAIDSLYFKWRRGWDSNPRTRLGVTHFPGVRLRPLGHLSTRPQGYRRRPTRSNGARTPRKPARTGGPRVSVPGRPGRPAGDAYPLAALLGGAAL